MLQFRSYGNAEALTDVIWAAIPWALRFFQIAVNKPIDTDGLWQFSVAQKLVAAELKKLLRCAMPPKKDIVGQQPVQKSRKHFGFTSGRKKLLCSTSGTGNVLPIVEPNVAGPYERSELVELIPAFVNADSGKLRWKMPTEVICDPLNIGYHVHFCSPPLIIFYLTVGL